MKQDPKMQELLDRIRKAHADDVVQAVDKARSFMAVEERLLLTVGPSDGCATGKNGCSQFAFLDRGRMLRPRGG